MELERTVQVIRHLATMVQVHVFGWAKHQVNH